MKDVQKYSHQVITIRTQSIQPQCSTLWCDFKGTLSWKHHFL